MDSIHHILKKILFPTHCILCGKTDVVLCGQCLTLLPTHIKINKHLDFTEITVMPYNQKKVAKLIWQLKYKNNQELRTLLFSKIGPLITETIGKESLSLEKIPTYSIVSVPKQEHDTKGRDFDHGFLLGQELGKHLKTGRIVYHKNMFIKKTAVRQAEMHNKLARIKNMRNCIVYNSKITLNPFQNSNTLIIIDDVTTTGATRDEMIRMCRNYFTGKIVFVALAH